MNRILMTMVLATLIPAVALVEVACTRGALDKAKQAELALIVQGGLMYDDWGKTLGKALPKQIHPSYLSTGGKAQGADTWRCRECHGWDYRGKEPDYSSGNHFSGFRGIHEVLGGNEISILSHLKSTGHRFGEHLSGQDLDALVLFITKGQMDMEPFIDRKSKKAKGDPAAGASLYRDTCAPCHGDDGKKLRLGDEKNIVTLGASAQENPWRALHKIRFGEPGQNAPPLLGAPVQQQVDVLAHVQTLPAR